MIEAIKAKTPASEAPSISPATTAEQAVYVFGREFLDTKRVSDGTYAAVRPTPDYPPALLLLLLLLLSAAPAPACSCSSWSKSSRRGVGKGRWLLWSTGGG